MEKEEIPTKFMVVSVMKDSVVVGHLPRKISPIASTVPYERWNNSVSSLGKKTPVSSTGVHASRIFSVI